MVQHTTINSMTVPIGASSWGSMPLLLHISYLKPDAHVLAVGDSIFLYFFAESPIMNGLHMKCLQWMWMVASNVSMAIIPPSALAPISTPYQGVCASKYYSCCTTVDTKNYVTIQVSVANAIPTNWKYAQGTGCHKTHGRYHACEIGYRLCLAATAAALSSTPVMQVATLQCGKLPRWPNLHAKFANRPWQVIATLTNLCLAIEQLFWRRHRASCRRNFLFWGAILVHSRKRSKNHSDEASYFCLSNLFKKKNTTDRRKCSRSTHCSRFFGGIL